jgi:hypothetical protein
MNYEQLVIDPPTSAIVAVNTYKAKFWAFNEEGERLNKGDGESFPETLHITY